MSTTNARLNRQTFSISRELEYFSEAELSTQTGYGKENWWPGVVAKELIDNSLDACEQVETPPRIVVDFQGDSPTVADNGPGLQPKTLEHVLDFGSRTKTKSAMSRRRGAPKGRHSKPCWPSPLCWATGRPRGGGVRGHPAYHHRLDRSRTSAAAG